MPNVHNPLGFVTAFVERQICDWRHRRCVGTRTNRLHTVRRVRNSAPRERQYLASVTVHALTFIGTYGATLGRGNNHGY